MTGDSKSDEVKGRVEEAVGALTNDDEKRSEGRSHQASGKLHEAGEQIKGAAADMKDALVKAKEALTP